MPRSSTRRFSFCLAAVSLLLQFSIARGADNSFGPDFTITSYHANITIHKNSAVSVDEIVEIELRQPVEALWRDIPADFVNSRGDMVGVYVSIEESYVDSRKVEQPVVDRLGGMVRVQLPIGTDAWGKYRLELKYTIENAVQFLSEDDQFVWDIVGKNWRAEILAATATIHFESGVGPNDIEIDCSTGSLGYRTGDCLAEISGGEIVYSSTRALRAFEGLTLAVYLPKGVLLPPTAWQRIIWHYNLRSNWLFALPLASLLIMVWRWARKRRLLRKPQPVRSIEEVPSLDGPRLSPADLGVIYSERFSVLDIAATFFDLGTRGLLQLQEQVEPLFRDFVICPKGDGSQSLTDYEQLLVDVSQEVPDGHRPLMSFFGEMLLTKIDLLRSAIEMSLVKRGYLHTPPVAFKKRAFIAAVSLSCLTLALGLLFTELHIALILPIATFSGVPLALIGCFDTVKTERGFKTYQAILGLKNYISGSNSSQAAPECSASEFERLLPVAVALDVTGVWAHKHRHIESEIPEWYLISAASAPTTVNSRFFHGVSHSILLRLSQISPSLVDDELDLDEIDIAIAKSAANSGGKRKHSRYNRR